MNHCDRIAKIDQASTYCPLHPKAQLLHVVAWLLGPFSSSAAVAGKGYEFLQGLDKELTLKNPSTALAPNFDTSECKKCHLIGMLAVERAKGTSYNNRVVTQIP